ncbi:chorismate pyruvate-lyase family protein [Nonomuraea sp. NPDC050643]|uniref:chorismate pyruvate-lyase family protein n=1 Tax=Nonomuraea sp. NPDC050643 TaxID=3155660 RepID=UPI0033EECAFA
MASFHSPLTRMLVSSDGSTTRLLEAATAGPLSIRVLRQTVAPALHATLQGPAELLGLPADASVVSRYSALLDDQARPVALNHVVAAPAIDAPTDQIIADPSRAIGIALALHQIDHRRQLLACGLADWPSAPGPTPAVVRTYLIWRGRQPLMFIRELFDPARVPAQIHDAPRSRPAGQAVAAPHRRTRERADRSRPTSPSAPDYRLGSSDTERQRLLAQCDLLRPAARALLDRLPLPDGARALDVGCGPLGIMDLLSAAVRPGGQVTGLDTDERMIAWARESVTAGRLANVSLIHGALPSPALGDGLFDLTHCRLLLINNTQPGDLLREMAAVTRPGGWIAAQEFDWASWQCDPPHPAWDRLKTVIAEVFGGDVHIGARLPTLFREAGVARVHMAAHAFYWRPGDRYQTLLLHFAELFAHRITANGTPPDALQALTHALREHLTHPDTVVREALLVQAWGRTAERAPVP